MVNGEKEGRKAAGTDHVKEVPVPLGTMLIVLVYGVVTMAMWGYMYYILLKSGGYLGGF